MPASALRPLFSRCEALGELDHGLGVGSQEQGQPILLCADPREDWETTWAQLRDYA